MEQKYIFVVQGFSSQDQLGNLTDVCKIEVLDTNEKSALKRAKNLINKKFYRVSAIVEYTEALKKQRE